MEEESLHLALILLSLLALCCNGESPPPPGFSSCKCRDHNNDEAVKAGYWLPEFSGYMPTRSIHASLFTHIIYASEYLDQNGFTVTVPPGDEQLLAGFSATMQEMDGSVRTLLSVGGNATVFSAMAANATLRKGFIDSSIALARQHGFHGLDLAWKFPQTVTDMENFGFLVIEWRASLQEEAMSSGLETLLLTAAVYFSEEYFDGLEKPGYPIQAIVESLDWIHVICFDYHGSLRSSTVNSQGTIIWSDNKVLVSKAQSHGFQLRDSHSKSLTFHSSTDPAKNLLGKIRIEALDNDPFNHTASNAALYDLTSHFSTSYGIRSWLDSGVPANKIVMGLPMFGRSWVLKSKRKVGIGAPAVAAGPKMKQSKQAGFMGYSEILGFVKDNNATVVVDNSTVSAYCYVNHLWVSYDNEQTTALKTMYAKSEGLFGYFFWAISYDLNLTLAKTASDTWDKFCHESSGNALESSASPSALPSYYSPSTSSSSESPFGVAGSATSKRSNLLYFSFQCLQLVFLVLILQF